MNQYKLSWCNWSVADKKETSSVLKPGSTAEGPWPLEFLTESGFFVRERLRQTNSALFDSLGIRNPEE